MPAPSSYRTLTRHQDEPPTPSPEDGNSVPRLTVRDLPDPLNRYESFKTNAIQSGYEMDIPQVLDSNGNLVLPTEYKDCIPEGTLIAATGSMKMWARSIFCRPLSLLTFVLKGTTSSLRKDPTVVPTCLSSNESESLEMGWLLQT